MSKTIIQFENISKLYQLGEISTGTISRDLSRWWALRKGKADPISKIGEDQNHVAEKAFWALKDISFEVKQGEVLGIIGGNGAGKSTLLKILSRVTKPTSGRIKIRGRIASLLEVGTGFHPDLTGRENIFLNGAILGMRKHEILSRLDEIVAFAGVERYLDTPVKRYSSGMYVRLAFAVAAHLEPEILVIDEVLAVGDSDFQKKCISKMKDVSQNHGRTVLFVSHNMASVKSICPNSIFLENGALSFQGKTDDVIDQYLQNLTKSQSHFSFDINSLREMSLTFLTISDIHNQVCSTFAVAEPWQIKVGFQVHYPLANLIIAIGILTSDNILLRNIASEPVKVETGNYEAVFLENEIFYGQGSYQIIVSISNNKHVIQRIEENIFVTFNEVQILDNFLSPKNKSLIMNKMNIKIYSS